MIVFLRGLISTVGTGHVDLDVHGVGYRVFITEPHAAGLLPGQETMIYTHHHVREDAVQLFGFESVGGRDWFELLIGVSGIGPKGALQILSGIDAPGLAGAIASDDVDELCRLPGVGKKTAQRMIVELKEKISKLEWTASILVQNQKTPKMSPASSLEQDTVDALIALGYHEKQAIEMVRQVIADTQLDDVSEILRAALQRLAV